MARIAEGDTLPNVSVQIWDDSKGGPKTVTTEELFANKKVVLFGVPGAFTPTCSNKHCPSYTRLAKDLREKGVDLIACIAVNDIFVMRAWGEHLKALNDIVFIGDGSAVFTKATGLVKDLTAVGMGIRCHRFAMIIDNLKVKHVAVDESAYSSTSAESILAKL